ncbi:MAG: hypothetical protein WDN46_04810 [Methylocella sp.]
MARKPLIEKPPVVEIIPSVAQGISATASANAPFLYFERAPFFGHLDGVGKVTIETSRHIAKAQSSNEVYVDRVIVAHLVGSLDAMKSLRSALDALILLAGPNPGNPSN